MGGEEELVGHGEAGMKPELARWRLAQRRGLGDGPTGAGNRLPGAALDLGQDA